MLAINGPNWEEFTSGSSFVTDEISASYDTVMSWTDAERSALGIKAIKEEPTPDGKTVVSKTIKNVRGNPVYVYEYMDLPIYVPEVISDRQFAEALAQMDIISKEEALSFVGIGKIPQAMQTVIDSIPDEDLKFSIEIAVTGATTFERNHPKTKMLIAALGWTDETADDLWKLAASIE